MILYLGSSSLIKLYVREVDTDIIRGWVKAAEIVATCRIAYTEVVSALDVRLKKGDLSNSEHDLIVKQFAEDWQNIAKIDFDDREAGNLVREYGLTRFGALHLSAAKLILKEYRKHRVELETTHKRRFDVDLFFFSADERLSRAAAAEGLKVPGLEVIAKNIGR
ncbi:type II toxin-antitoxin system VapC family toxin [Syntrophorhabdus aromaticivorans]|jgi:predicted nucleic acid-binding protein|uniref:Type II toxin-antitoxin system VapC family toxin n=1 Tax=Syntrophorhabdus aromaticivorans TaxID=328301 RepID=A0A971S1R3_9BACT|nr:type II toxin-antitoxin system VapC family toxin [Syntrophorhabdus aromaticivorans]NLW36468.1 type II toxin-antitoxin system VapC family toxin [Syntrophorhabdus aromaticivorans]